MRRLLLTFTLGACTSEIAPDAVTLYGGPTSSAYDLRGSSAGYDAHGYEAGAALTWNIGANHREAERQLAKLDQQFMMLASVMREQRAQQAAPEHSEPTVIFGPQLPPSFAPPAEEKRETPTEHEEKEESITIKGTLKMVGIAALAIAVAILEKVRRGMNRNKKNIESMKQKKQEEKKP